MFLNAAQHRISITPPIVHIAPAATPKRNSASHISLHLCCDVFKLHRSNAPLDKRDTALFR